MCSSFGVIIRSDSRFSFLPSLPTPAKARASLPDPFLRFPATATPFSNSWVGIRNRVGSFRSPRAVLNDASVASPPPPGEAMTFYELLGIPETGSLVEIKHAYKQLARKYHPDVSPPDRVEEYTQRFIRVSEAYETLSDPKRRAFYDRDMARGLGLAFSARRQYQTDDERNEWKSCWQVQLSELKRRSMNKDMDGNVSWAERMRQRWNETSAQ